MVFKLEDQRSYSVRLTERSLKAAGKALSRLPRWKAAKTKNITGDNLEALSKELEAGLKIPGFVEKSSVNKVAKQLCSSLYTAALMSADRSFKVRRDYKKLLGMRLEDIMSQYGNQIMMDGLESKQLDSDVSKQKVLAAMSAYRNQQMSWQNFVINYRPKVLDEKEQLASDMLKPVIDEAVALVGSINRNVESPKIKASKNAPALVYVKKKISRALAFHTLIDDFSNQKIGTYAYTLAKETNKLDSKLLEDAGVSLADPHDAQYLEGSAFVVPKPLLASEENIYKSPSISHLSVTNL